MIELWTNAYLWSTLDTLARIFSVQWISQNAGKVTHLKGRLLDQAANLFNYRPFQNGNFS